MEKCGPQTYQAVRMDGYPNVFTCSMPGGCLHCTAKRSVLAAASGGSRIHKLNSQSAACRARDIQREQVVELRKACHGSVQQPTWG